MYQNVFIIFGKAKVCVFQFCSCNYFGRPRDAQSHGAGALSSSGSALRCWQSLKWEQGVGSLAQGSLCLTSDSLGLQAVCCRNPELGVRAGKRTQVSCEGRGRLPPRGQMPALVCVWNSYLLKLCWTGCGLEARSELLGFCK